MVHLISKKMEGVGEAALRLRARDWLFSLLSLVPFPLSYSPIKSLHEKKKKKKKKNTRLHLRKTQVQFSARMSGSSQQPPTPALGATDASCPHRHMCAHTHEQ